MTGSKIKNCKIAQKHSNQWENTINGETCLSKESELLSKFLSLLTPSHFRRIRGTCAHSSSPEPPCLVENIPPRSRYLVTIAFLQKTHISRAFSGNLLETNAAKVSPSPRKWEHICDPLVYSSVCVCGGGGGGHTSHSLRVQNRLFMSEIGYIQLWYSLLKFHCQKLPHISRGY